MLEQNINQTHSYLTQRFLACFIDYTFLFAYFFIMLLLFGKDDGNGNTSITGFPAFSVILVWFLLMVFIEQLNGATMGNTLMDLKPISINSHTNELSFRQSLKRHLVDMIDMSFFGLVGILLIKNSKHNQRLGDIWAKTIVINTKRNC